MEPKSFISVEEADSLEHKFQKESTSPQEFLSLAGLESINDGHLDLFWGMDHTGTEKISRVRGVNKKKWLLTKIKYAR